MTPRRPYLLRAFYDWLVDNDLTPHLVVDATLQGVKVPTEFVSDGQIVLNIAPRAVGNLELGNEAISFNARFSGRPHSVIVPMYAALAIYARENGQEPCLSRNRLMLLISQILSWQMKRSSMMRLLRRRRVLLWLR